MAERLPDTHVPDPPTDELLAKVGLTREEYQNVCVALKRKPNVVEMGIFGAMWSEHCCYKSSKRYLQRLPVAGKRVLQGPGENAGVIDLGGDLAVVFKIESHNHPSAVEPFQGAATGVGGIIRDIFAMGARPIACLDSLRFGNLEATAPVGVPPGAINGQAADAAEAASAAEADSDEMPAAHGVKVAWSADPKPYVVTLAWMTNARKPIFERGPAARRAVEAIRAMHNEAAEILAYCVMPDGFVLAVHFATGGEEDAARLVAELKASLGDVGKEVLRPNEPLWEPGFRSSQKLDQSEMDEAIKRIEYTPIQRGVVKQVKDYPYVSQAWHYGVAFAEQADKQAHKPAEAPYCAGVTEEQAARNRFLLGGVVSGIAHYGNCIGIPTVGGEVVFDPSYTHNCLVNAMCVGIAKKKDLIKARAHGPGNPALIVGARTGRDGVQGATFASVDLPEDYASQRPAVQVGDPFMEKLLLEATLEILRLPGLVGVQDFGAAGLTCSGVEMAARAGTGMRLNLDAVPQRAADLSAYEMMLSESQERMMVVVEAGSEQPFLDVFKKWGLTAVHCGDVLKDQHLVVLHAGVQVADLPNSLLGDDAPDYDRPYAEPAYYTNRQRLGDTEVAEALERIGQLPRSVAEAGATAPQSLYEDLLRRLLAFPSIANKQWVYRQYDHMVRTNTLAGPGLTDAAVLRVKESGQGLVIATDGSGRHVYLDPALGAARAVLESARNVLACGAQPLGVTNCLNFGSPEKPDRMWQFAQCIEGMRQALTELELPVTGGNVSFYNETGGRPVLPTPVIGMVGLLERVQQYVRNRVEEPGLELYLLGESDGRLDGSTLLFDIGRLRAGELADHDYLTFRSCERFLIKAAQEEALTACHDIADGGLLVALIEMCATGASIDLPGPLPELYDVEEHNRIGALFGEEGHRWIIAVNPEQRSWVRTAALHFNVKLKPLGRTAENQLSVASEDRSWFKCPWAPLVQCHERGLSALME
jgi:phosphoribosylformylglycinamidine synthase subunit PurL